MTFRSFEEFYPYYLKQHKTPQCRRLHFIGTSMVIALAGLIFFTGKLILVPFLPLMVYGLSGLGHLLYEKNVPLSLKFPWYNIRGDFRLFWDILRGRVQAF